MNRQETRGHCFEWLLRCGVGGPENSQVRFPLFIVRNKRKNGSLVKGQSSSCLLSGEW